MTLKVAIIWLPQCVHVCVFIPRHMYTHIHLNLCMCTHTHTKPIGTTAEAASSGPWSLFVGAITVLSHCCLVASPPHSQVTFPFGLTNQKGLMSADVGWAGASVSQGSKSESQMQRTWQSEWHFRTLTIIPSKMLQHLCVVHFVSLDSLDLICASIEEAGTDVFIPGVCTKKKMYFLRKW